MERLPALNTGHLLTMTDDTGILQHAIFSVPNTSEGYTTDDNARALIVSILLDENLRIQIGENTRISLIAISHFSGLPFMLILEGSETFSVTTASGLRIWFR